MFAHNMSDKFSQLYCFLDQKQNPESVEESKRALEDHRSVRLKVRLSLASCFGFQIYFGLSQIPPQKGRCSCQYVFWT